ncbi:hypothetical protein E4U49_000786 [Claviceps purpurea]|nr:hypothetical protein E4U49_000786 [Claviceps purpurea]
MNSDPTPTQTGSSAAEQSDFFAATEVARVFNLPAVQDGAQWVQLKTRVDGLESD